MKNKITGLIGLSLVLILFMQACVYVPEKATVVSNFDANRYLGTWYEIARLDHRFEKDMDNVIAQYKLNEKGDVIVRNSGYDTVRKEWKSADGLAKFRGDRTEAALKVSFFGPFYSGYNVVALDSSYQYALVAGKNLDYLWILSREKNIPDTVKTAYLAQAKAIGYDVSKFIWVNQDQENPFVNEK